MHAWQSQKYLGLNQYCGDQLLDSTAVVAGEVVVWLYGIMLYGSSTANQYNSYLVGGGTSPTLVGKFVFGPPAATEWELQWCSLHSETWPFFYCTNIVSKLELYVTGKAVSPFHMKPPEEGRRRPCLVNSWYGARGSSTVVIPCSSAMASHDMESW